jgi:hypothetical protein
LQLKQPFATGCTGEKYKQNLGEVADSLQHPEVSILQIL